jgi:hypothetical protein
MEKPYLGMVGYKAEGPPFMALDVDTDGAKDIARENDLSEYFLVPGREGYKHAGYIRVGPGEYKKTFTRIAVFRHLLNKESDWIPTEEESRTGDKLDHSSQDPDH